MPNGCDCFGCCTVEYEGQLYDVFLGAPDCSLDNFDACPACEMNEDCDDPCEDDICELCFGQDPEDLPEECDEPECPDGVQPCEVDADCPEQQFCQTGCCVPVPQ